jgi:pimeloyl-ACP methyl ester carboxylesterase
MKPHAIFIPGIMGSELYLRDELIWPGSAASLIFPYKKMKELLRDDLSVGGLIRKFSIAEQYDAAIRDLGIFGFRENDATLTLLPYDWRRSNIEAAEKLADVVDRVVAEGHGGVEVLFIAHSMGGLISRYYLESGKFKARPGFAAVRWLITLGTPHRGAPLALAAAVGIEKRLFLSAEQVHRLVSDLRYPSVYELLPPPGEPFAWDGVTGSRLSPLDVYDPDVASKLQLVPESLDAARAFWSRLDPARRPEAVRYFFFAGTRQVTITAVSLDLAAVQPVTKIETDDAGDGTVPVWSAMLSGLQVRPVGGEHGTIYKNEDLRRTLGALLGYTGTLPALERIEVAVRDRVVEPSAVIQVALTVAAGVQSVEGEIRLSRAEVDEAGTLVRWTSIAPSYPLRYEGVKAEGINVRFDAPEYPGIYKVAFHTAAGTLIGNDDLFVQERDGV